MQWQKRVRFRAGMENKQILDGLYQDNEIIQIENGRGQFSHYHVFCLTFFPLSPIPSIPASHFNSLALWYAHMPFSLYCSVLLLFSVNSQCGNVERNPHRKQSPIRIALFMSRHCLAYKKGANAWIRRRWAESGLIDNMHILHLQASKGYTQIHRDTHMHAYPWSHRKCPQPPSPISPPRLLEYKTSVEIHVRGCKLKKFILECVSCKADTYRAWGEMNSFLSCVQWNWCSVLPGFWL